jgi:hypothetical protein
VIRTTTSTTRQPSPKPPAKTRKASALQTLSVSRPICPQAPVAQAAELGRAKRPGPSRDLQSTSTVARDGRVVPWLAAEGPLAYSPEAPPDRDYYFEYNRVLPSIFAEGVNLRCRHFFGAARKEDCRELLTFWHLARAGNTDRVCLELGTIARDTVAAPLAVYRIPVSAKASRLVLHGIRRDRGASQGGSRDLGSSSPLLSWRRMDDHHRDVVRSIRLIRRPDDLAARGLGIARLPEQVAKRPIRNPLGHTVRAEEPPIARLDVP